MNFNVVKVEKAGSICTLTLNRPDHLNSTNIDMLEQLTAAIKMAGEDSDIRVVILTGEGRGFCSGADMEFVTWLLEHKGPQFRRVLRDVVNRAVNSLEQLEKPVIAAVNGYAVGGGVEIALACDFRIASEKAVFSFSEVKVGIIPDGGGIPRLSRLLGVGKAKELILLGRSFDGREAERMGLVNRCVPHEQLETEARRWAEELTACAPLAVGMAKRLIDQTMDVDLTTALEMMGIAQQELLASEDLKVGIRAFLQKRKPVFKGI
jgi:enoyl-CoA hydratase